MTKVGICGTVARGTRGARVYSYSTATLKTPSPHHNQVWAAGGAVIRPHLENAESQKLQGQAWPSSFITDVYRLSLLIPMYTELQSAQRTRVSAAPTAEMQKLVEVATKNAAPRVSSKGKNKRIPKNLFVACNRYSWRVISAGLHFK